MNCLQTELPEIEVHLQAFNMYKNHRALDQNSELN